MSHVDHRNFIIDLIDLFISCSAPVSKKMYPCAATRPSVDKNSFQHPRQYFFTWCLTKK